MDQDDVLLAPQHWSHEEWQTHFAKVMNELCFHRCKTDSILYCRKSTELYVLCYIDDLLVCGTPERTKEFTDRFSQEVLLKVEGELKPQTSVNFLGRTLKHNGDSIDVSMNTAYVTYLLKLKNHHQPLEQVLFPKFNLNHRTEMSARSIVPL